MTFGPFVWLLEVMTTEDFFASSNPLEVKDTLESSTLYNNTLEVMTKSICSI